MAVQLGQKYKDTISEWEGVATGVYKFLNGCLRVTLAGNKDGKPEEFTFDVQQLVDEDGNPADSAFVQIAERQTEVMNQRLAEREEDRVAMAAPVRTGGPRPTPARTGL